MIVVHKLCIKHWAKKTKLYGQACHLTQWYLLSRICWQQEDEQSQAGDEHTGNEQVQTIVQCTSAHRYCKCHVRVRLLTALIIQLITLPRDPWQNTKGHIQAYVVQQQTFSTNTLHSGVPLLFVTKIIRYCLTCCHLHCDFALSHLRGLDYFYTSND